MMEIEQFFNNHETHCVQHITRHDAIGGEMYVRVERVRGKVVLSIGDDENGEVPVKTVSTDEEIQQFMRALR